MTTTTTLADIAATSLVAVRTLERYGLDYCCGGKQAIGDACSAKGLDASAVMQEIEQSLNKGGGDRDWQNAPLGELARHIIATHHEYLRQELPAVGARMEKVLRVHGGRDPQTLTRMATVYDGLRSELEAHIAKEEQILFPFIAKYAQAEAQGQPVPPVPFGSIANPIAMMEREHEGAGDALVELRTLTNNYELPSYACTTVRMLFDGLQALEADLHVHIHLENNILFPRAIALERR